MACCPCFGRGRKSSLDFDSPPNPVEEHDRDTLDVPAHTTTSILDKRRSAFKAAHTHDASASSSIELTPSDDPPAKSSKSSKESKESKSLPKATAAISLRRDKPIPKVAVRLDTACYAGIKLYAQVSNVEPDLEYKFQWQRSAHITTGWENCSQETPHCTVFTPTIDEVNCYVRMKVFCEKSEQLELSNTSWVGIDSRLQSPLVAQLMAGEARFAGTDVDSEKSQLVIKMDNSGWKIKKDKGSAVAKRMVTWKWTELAHITSSDAPDAQTIADVHYGREHLAIRFPSVDDRILFTLTFRAYHAMGVKEVVDEVLGVDVGTKWRKCKQKELADVVSRGLKNARNNVLTKANAPKELQQARDVLVALKRAHAPAPVNLTM